jgi:serine/threonine protein kinase
MHKMRIFHYDISDGNIMIDMYGNGRLVDFDVSKPLDYAADRPTWVLVGNKCLNAKDQSLTRVF